MNRSALLAGFLVLTVALLVAAYLSLPAIAGWGLREVLRSQGFPNASLTVRHIGLTRSEIADIDLGGESGARVSMLAVDYSPGRLAEGIIDGVSLQAPMINIRLDAGGIDLGPLGRLVEDGSEGKASSVMRMLGPVSVVDGRIAVTTPVGTVNARLDGTLLFTDGLGTKADARFALDHPDARVDGRLNGIVDATDQVQFDVTIDSASSDARLAFAQLSGALRIGGQLPAALDGDGSLTMRGVRFDGLDIGNVDVSGSLTDRAAEAELLLGGAGTGLSVQMRAATENFFDPAATLELSGDVATDGLRGPFKLPGDIDVVGALVFAFEGARSDLQALPAALQNGDVRAEGAIDGSLTADMLALTVPSLKLDATMNGTASLRIDARGWRLQPHDTLAIDLGAATAGGAHHVKAILGGMPEAPFAAGGPAAADPVRIGMTVGGVVDDTQPLSGQISGNIWAGQPDGVRLENLTVRLDPLEMRLGGTDFGVQAATVRMNGTAADLSIDVAAETRFSGMPLPGVEVTGGQAVFESRINYGADGVKAFPQGCADVRATLVSFRGTDVRPGPMMVCPQADGTPFLHAVIDDAEDASGFKRIDLAGVLMSSEVAVTGAGPYPLSGTLPRLDGSGSFDIRRGTWWGKLHTDGGNLRLEGPDVAIADMDSVLNIEGRETLLGARLALARARLVDHRRPSRFIAVTLRGNGTHTGEALSFTGNAGQNAGPEAAIKVVHNLGDGKGSASARIAPWSMTPGAAQPQVLLPMLEGLVTKASGSLAAEADMDWTTDDTHSSGKLTLRDVAFATAPAEVAGIDGVLSFADLLHLKSAGEQSLRIGFVDAGLPLSDGVAKFNLPGDRAIHVDSVLWPLAGGRLVIRDLRLPLDALPDMIVADIEGVDAATLVGMADIADLQAEGNLSGRVPVRLTDDGPVIDHATLTATGGGVLRYRSASAAATLKQSGQSAELLARALDDFQYTKFRLTLDGPLTGNITAEAQIDGANPKLYSGQRIELNVRLQGALRDLLQSASVINVLPESIRDRVQSPSGKP